MMRKAKELSTEIPETIRRNSAGVGTFLEEALEEEEGGRRGRIKMRREKERRGRERGDG